MPIADILKEIGEGLADGLKEIGLDAVADVGNTYQSVLMQDTGWNLQSTLSDLTQHTAEGVAKEQLEQGHGITHDNTLDLGY